MAWQGRQPLCYPHEVAWRLPKRLLLPALTPLYRVQASLYSSPVFFSDSTDNRYNPPEQHTGAFKVFYAALEDVGAICERAFPKSALEFVVESQLAALLLWTLRTTRMLQLVDLGGAALHQLRIDGQVNTTPHIPYAQAWSHALHSALPDVDGLLYPVRTLPNVQAIALYDRAIDALHEADAFSVPLLAWEESDTGRDLRQWAEEELSVGILPDEAEP
ncbi:MAG: RES family NAD+ phosphorylase [Nitrococcus sp.]|nr:RES family NAD+ phosphorylase [Nitrococcus sp.]